mgnify:CR=1 FL=1
MTFEFTYIKPYGGRYQPTNEYAKLLAKLMKRRTLTPANIEICRKLGFVIEIKEN